MAAEDSVREQEERDGGWYPHSYTPTPGERYEFEDFIGVRFVATFESHEWGDLGDGDGDGLILHFADRADFKTNLPIRFRDVIA